MTARKSTPNPLPTQERLRELLDYNPETGVFLRKASGKVAGSLDREGYIKIYVDRQKFYAHRLAFAWMIGECPYIVDHANRIRQDNRWENLRKVTKSQNAANSKISIRNTTGHKGVYWYKRKKKWCARILDGKKKLNLGYFSNINDARAAYNAAAEKLWGDFTYSP